MGKIGRILHDGAKGNFAVALVQNRKRIPQTGLPTARGRENTGRGIAKIVGFKRG